MDIIRHIQNNEFADISFDPYEPYVDFFTGSVMPVPLSAAPEPKRRFVPSKWEALKVSKIVRAIRKGWIKLKDETEAEMEGATTSGEKVFDIWSGEVDSAILSLRSRHVSAPKIALPDHRESYNPPEEYLLTPEEEAEWSKMEEEDRPYNYLPKKYASLRKVPGYEKMVQERYGRCLDLFLCPRSIKDKITMDPDDLLPKLPDPRDLKPFPTQKSIDFIGHADSVNGISVDPSGQWLLSCSKDGSVKLWELQTGHCRYTWEFAESLGSISWNPNRALFMFAVAVGSTVHLIVPHDLPSTETTHSALKELFDKNDNEKEVSSLKSSIKWIKSKDIQGSVYSILHGGEVIDLHWHRRGDYLAALAPTAPSGSQMLTIHQLSRRISQHPFKKMPGIMRSIRFHPSLPQIILATQKSIRIYDLVNHEQVKKLVGSVQSISSLSIHNGGDNVITGSHDGKVCWFDLDYSIRPYRVLNNHKGAIRSVAYHNSYPLFASAGDDGIVQVIHGQVFSDLSTNPQIVPVKTIRDFNGGVSINQIIFHPIQPWIICAISDGTISLFV